MSATVQATPSYDEFTLVASGYTWIMSGERSITWEYRLVSNSQWHTTKETVTGSPTSLTHKFTGLLPGREFIYRVTFTDGGGSTSVQGSVTTLSEVGTLSITHTSASSLTATFGSYVTASYSRVAKFRYTRKPNYGEDPKTIPSYECGTVSIPPNVTDKKVEVLITGLRNYTTYNVTMDLYRVSYHGATQNLSLIKSYTVSGLTKIPDSELPDVEIFSITQRYDTRSLKIKMNTDYEGLYRFVLFICDDVDSTYWHTLVLPPGETEFTSNGDIITKFKTEDFTYSTPWAYTYTHRTDNVDVKACIIVENDAEESVLTENNYTYQIGNAVDIQEPHTTLVGGMVAYGMTASTNVEFDLTQVIPMAIGGFPFDITGQQILNLARILAIKFEEPYNGYTFDEWKQFCEDHPMSTLARLYDDEGEEALSEKVDELKAEYENLIRSMDEAVAGAPVYANQGSLIKSMEIIAEALASATVWHEDAKPYDLIGREYFNDLSSDIKQTP